MAWVAIAERGTGLFHPSGVDRLGKAPDDAFAPDRLVTRGTIMVETRLSVQGRPQTLLAFRHAHPFAGGFSLRALPGGGIVLAQNFGSEMRHATLPHDQDARADLVRITYAWDAEAGWGRLALEHLADGRIFTGRLDRAHAMPLADMRLVALSPQMREMDDEVVFAAMADHIQPIGPLPALAGSVPVATPKGDIAARDLRRGDHVHTGEDSITPVLQTARMTVPARGCFRPVRLRAPFFGLTRDIHVAPHQRLIMRGSQVEYMFGTEAVLIPARHLVNQSSAFFCSGMDLVTYHHLLLPGHTAIMAAGCAVESLYIGRIRRKPEALAASVLASCDRARLPEHGKPVWPVLKPFEAITLATTRAA